MISQTCIQRARANVTIPNSGGCLFSAEVDQMINAAELLKQVEKEFFAKQELKLCILQVEATITSPEIGMKIKQNKKAAVEAELPKALEKLEIEGESYIPHSLGNSCPF
ncbi:hypothetical protein PCANC_14772 [Puccinia coronata f. sp. avenae]|uniref:Uncharacterized protein n=1 Tax=Puccinia coronata f. sp. avenae TaxID=200324 RepID=A0A2N5SNU3_9BASI|nr:hypothetical protein PCANC_14772 [Puccinia coronata f. sp. avenae]